MGEGGGVGGVGHDVTRCARVARRTARWRYVPTWAADGAGDVLFVVFIGGGLEEFIRKADGVAEVEVEAFGGVGVEFDNKEGGSARGHAGVVFGLAGVDIDDFTGRVKEDDVEGDKGVVHPEGVGVGLVEDEEHAMVGGHGGAEHEAAGVLFFGGGDFELEGFVLDGDGDGGGSGFCGGDCFGA